MRFQRFFCFSVATQVTGEAIYTDDMPSPVGALYAGLVLSTKPHAKLLGVDPSEALKLEGVLRYVGSGDVPGGNAIGAVVMDEEVFADSEVWTPLVTLINFCACDLFWLRTLFVAFPFELFLVFSLFNDGLLLLIPSIIFALFFLFSFSLARCNSDPGPLCRCFSPLPITVRAFFYITERFPLFLPFVDSHRIVPYSVTAP